MSFRQDRTNPSSAVSNWKGRSETPKGHPSTRVSMWLNSAMFTGASRASWFAHWQGPSNIHAQGRGICVDTSDNIYVEGLLFYHAPECVEIRLLGSSISDHPMAPGTLLLLLLL